MKKCRTSRIGWLIGLVNFVGAFIPLGAQVPGMVLSSPSVSSNGFQFSLNAESGVGYAIQASSNLVDWIAVGTNTDPGITRAVTITNPPAGANYYRAARDPLPLFTGLTAKGTIQFFGGAYLDSFDSTNGPYSLALARSNAVALTDSTTNGAIFLSGGAYIAGNAVTGPGGTVTTTNGAIVTGTIGNNANVQINDPTFPTFFTNSGSPYSIVVPPGGLLGGTNYDAIFTNKNYELSSLGFGGGSPNFGTKMAVTGNVVIYLTQTGNNVFVVGGPAFVYIAPGASLTIFSAGNVTISGGGVVNGNQNANTCFIYGLKTCTAVTYAGGANFIGVVDAPEANVIFSGPERVWSGAGIANSFNISGTSGVHYDENLARVGPTR